MYVRRVDGQQTNFFVSGMLWGGSLVMRDELTKSEWSHILGEAMDGPQKGNRLEVIPSVITTLDAWKADYPETTVSMLERVAIQYTDKFYENMPTMVVGLIHQGETVAYDCSRLARQVVTNDKVGGDPVVVCFDLQGTGVKIFRSTLDGEAIEFEWDNEQMTGGGSQWSLTTGEALTGPHQGKRLEVLNSVLSKALAWWQFHEGCRFYGDAGSFDEFLRPALIPMSAGSEGERREFPNNEEDGNDQ